jgi:diguanylate cyclase (GGDEF)-like protein
MLDMDELKHVNDTRGHDAGDSLLVACAMAWEEALRGCDFLARIGGDEFALLLPGCEAEEAAAIIDRVREACEDVRFSAGIATLCGSDSARTLLSRADEALYRAKADGRGISAVAR